MTEGLPLLGGWAMLVLLLGVLLFLVSRRR